MNQYRIYLEVAKGEFELFIVEMVWAYDEYAMVACNGQEFKVGYSELLRV